MRNNGDGHVNSNVADELAVTRETPEGRGGTRVRMTGTAWAVTSRRLALGLVASKVNDTVEGEGGRDRFLRSDDTEG